MEAIAKESARAIFHSPNYRYLPTSRRELLDFKLLWNLKNRDFSNSLILGFDSYLQLLKFGNVKENTCNLYYTHQNYPINRDVFNRFSKILVMNNTLKSRLVFLGVLERKIQIVYGAVDKEVFNPFEGDSTDNIGLPESYVLVSSDCKPRKNPEKILSLIRYMPEVNFVIHGKGWESAFKNELEKMKNLKYFNFDYKDQPIFMRNAATFLS